MGVLKRTLEMLATFSRTNGNSEPFFLLFETKMGSHVFESLLYSSSGVPSSRGDTPKSRRSPGSAKNMIMLHVSLLSMEPAQDHNIIVMGKTTGS